MVSAQKTEPRVAGASWLSRVWASPGVSEPRRCAVSAMIRNGPMAGASGWSVVIVSATTVLGADPSGQGASAMR
jgi:hypothetical protein